MASVVEWFREAAADPKLQGPRMIGEPTLGPRTKYLGRVMSYSAKTSGGEVLQYNKLVTETPGWAVVAGLTKNFLLTQANYKAGVDKVEWSLAPGGIGRLDAQATPDEALAKVKEGFLRETGYGGGQWIYLGTEMIHSGLIRGSAPDAHGLWVHMYMAVNLEHIGDSKPAISESIRVKLVPLDEIGEVIDSGLFDECSSLTCLLLAERRLRKLNLIQ